MAAARVLPVPVSASEPRHDGPVLGRIGCRGGRNRHNRATSAQTIRDLQADRFRGTQPRGIGRGQRRTRLQRRHRLEKTDDPVGAQDRRQFVRRACIGDPLRYLRPVRRARRRAGCDRSRPNDFSTPATICAPWGRTEPHRCSWTLCRSVLAWPMRTRRGPPAQAPGNQNAQNRRRRTPGR